MPEEFINFAVAMDEILSQLKSLLLYDAMRPMLFNTGLFMVLFVLFLGMY